MFNHSKHGHMGRLAAENRIFMGSAANPAAYLPKCQNTCIKKLAFIFAFTFNDIKDKMKTIIKFFILITLILFVSVC